MEDLESEALIALLMSVRAFDATRGFQFSTYAHRAVTSRLRRAVAEAGLIRVSIGIVERHRRAGTEDTLPQAPLSLEWETCEDGVLAEVIPDSRPTPEEELLAEDEWLPLRLAIEALPAKLRDLILRRYGFRGPAESNQAISATMGVSRTTVFNCEREALSLLRAALTTV